MFLNKTITKVNKKKDLLIDTFMFALLYLSNVNYKYLEPQSLIKIMFNNCLLCTGYMDDFASIENKVQSGLCESMVNGYIQEIFE